MEDEQSLVPYGPPINYVFGDLSRLDMDEMRDRLFIEALAEQPEYKAALQAATMKRRARDYPDLFPPAEPSLAEFDQGARRLDLKEAVTVPLEQGPMTADDELKEYTYRHLSQL